MTGNHGPSTVYVFLKQQLKGFQKSYQDPSTVYVFLKQQLKGFQKSYQDDRGLS